MSDQTQTVLQPWLSLEPTGQLLRPGDVVKRTGLSRSQIYQMISEERFPPFIKLSTRASAMPESWLNAFIAMRAERRWIRKTTRRRRDWRGR